jgi:hypothetical protein
MFTRVVAINSEPGKVLALSKTIHDKILQFLKPSEVSWTRLYLCPTPWWTRSLP